MPIVAQPSNPGKRPFLMFGIGRNAALKINTETVWDVGGLFPWNETWDLGVSSVRIVRNNAADSVAGEGIGSVRLQGLNADGVTKTVIVTLTDTTTNVAGQWKFVQEIAGFSAGDLHVSAGQIDVMYGATTLTITRLDTGMGRSMNGFFEVPQNCEGWLERIYCSVLTGDNATFEVVVRNAFTNVENMIFQFNCDGGHVDIINTFEPLNILLEGNRVEMRAVSSNASGTETFSFVQGKLFHSSIRFQSDLGTPA